MSVGPAPIFRIRGSDLGPPESVQHSWFRLGAQVGWTATGLIALFSLVFVAHATEVAFDCTLYGIYEANGTAGGCPLLSWPTLLILGGFAISSSMISIGLSRNLVVFVSPSPASPRTHRLRADRHPLTLDFIGPFLAFFGWGVLAWGLTEPLLENCIEPCGYPCFPYVLEGTAFELSVLGGSALVLGAGVLAIMSYRRRRRRKYGAGSEMAASNLGRR